MTNAEQLAEYANRVQSHTDGYFGEARKPDENGIVWYLFGRNASHDFYLGVGADDQLYRRSVGEGDYDEKTGTYGVDEHVAKIASLNEPMYLGHW